MEFTSEGRHRGMSKSIYIPNGCKHFKVFLQIFYGNVANSNKSLKKKKKSKNWKISFTFSWYLKISLFTFTSYPLGMSYPQVWPKIITI